MVTNELEINRFNPGQSSYGVFSGLAAQTATLRFFPRVANEIASQRWHPSQTGRWEKQDYLLTIPYSEPTELVLDILRYGPDCVVEGPEALSALVESRLEQALGRYATRSR